MIERTMINSRLESIEARLSLIDKNIGSSATKKIMYFFPNTPLTPLVWLRHCLYLISCVARVCCKSVRRWLTSAPEQLHTDGCGVGLRDT